MQAQQALDLADEFGCLKRPDFTFDEFREMEPDLWFGTEHLVEFSQTNKRYHKITIPPGFGLTPKVIRIPVVDLRADSSSPKEREVIEFVPATPLEYLERWQASNDIFGDDVRLTSVIEWLGGAISFGITQPQYHGIPAEPRDIERCFLAAGWTRLKDPSGHVIYFNYAFGVVAIDAERRNCYLTNGELQPFDVILCRPDEAMEEFLAIYPRP
jgi:hypothetical protein